MDVLVADVIGDVALVILVSLLFGSLARAIGQPTVVGQITAGVLLGPSALGRLPGHLTSRLFPHPALPALSALAQVAVVIFMFAVGYELDRRPMDGRRRVSLVATCALVVPMAMGSGTALIFRSLFAALGTHVSQSFVLFIGVAMAITALPVLAAIIRERGLAGSVSAVTATSAAGIMDVSAWLILAVVLADAAQRHSRPWPVTVLLFGSFVLIMLLAVRPALRWWIRRRPSVLSNQLPVALALAMGSAWITSSLGLHPVFGGFLAGLTFPSADGVPDADLLRPTEEIGRLLLPLFFVVTGLSVNLGVLNDAAFLLLALVCAIASVGKLGPAYLASRLGGLGRQDSAIVAVLVNTRGLTELIALNVGLTAGLINEQVFSVLVLMALITTATTAPLLSLLGPPAGSKALTDQRLASPSSLSE